MAKMLWVDSKGEFTEYDDFKILFSMIDFKIRIWTDKYQCMDSRSICRSFHWNCNTCIRRLRRYIDEVME